MINIYIFIYICIYNRCRNCNFNNFFCFFCLFFPQGVNYISAMEAYIEKRMNRLKAEAESKDLDFRREDHDK